MKQELTEHSLQLENACFSGTAGVSERNRSTGFLPAFRDSATGDVFLSRFADGRRAPVHVLEGLPDSVVTLRSACGAIRAIKSSVKSGFLREGRFYTRTEAANAQLGHQ